MNLKHVGLAAVLISSSLWSSPMISVDTTDYDLGVIREGTRASVSHAFKIKNTGDSVLVIKDVRPG